MSTNVVKSATPEEMQIAVKKLDSKIFTVIGDQDLNGFERAYIIAKATGELKELLTPTIMAPIMDLQGNRLGFKTDRDLNKDGTKGPGYALEIVKNCMIEAVLTGVQPYGNQFNIISSNCYITKEGFGYLLSKLAGLSYKIIPQLPRMKDQSAAVVMNITWTYGGSTKTESIDFAIKVNAYMGADAVIGKATRKARAWLFNTITGSEVADGDIQDVEATVTGSKINEALSIEDIQPLFDMKKDALSESDRINATRIIENQEQNSYAKLYKLLQSK